MFSTAGILLLSIVFNGVLTCSPSEGWKPKSSGELASLVKYVVSGTPVEIIGREEVVSSAIVDVSCVYKAAAGFNYTSILGKNITVSGFTSSAACGVDASLNYSQIYFLDVDDAQALKFKLVSNDLHGGAKPYDEQNGGSVYTSLTQAERSLVMGDKCYKVIINESNRVTIAAISLLTVALIYMFLL
ncbi:hypothetical protein MP638_006418 [Amoeboaphelidium occidentale]|nr:hypothetical protein MP638_006418 [Amoeboaphelidium occidentale]